MMTQPPIVLAVRPSLCSNPFEGRPKIGVPRALILYRHWLAGDVTPYVLRCAGFSFDEVEALGRWHKRLMAIAPKLRSAILRCRCGRDALWCHVPPLRQFVGQTPLVPVSVEREHRRRLH